MWKSLVGPFHITCSGRRGLSPGGSQHSESVMGSIGIVFDIR